MTEPQVVTDLVAYAHVFDVQRSIDYYAYLGFKVEEVSLDDGVVVWALLVCERARLMLAQASAPIDPEQQAILFYLYAPDLAALREQLEGQAVPVGEIEHPDYLPDGVMRLADPDGYALLVAQEPNERRQGASEQVREEE